MKYYDEGVYGEKDERATDERGGTQPATGRR